MILLILLLCCIISQSKCQSLRYYEIGPDIQSPAGVLAFSQAYNISLSPVPINAPVIKIGYLLSLSGTDSKSDAHSVDMIQMMVDMTNAKGGVWMAGVQYAVSAVVIDDQASSILAQMAVNQLVNQHSVHIIVPSVIESIMKTIAVQSGDLDVSFVTAFASSSCTFQTGATNLYGLQLTGLSLYHPTLRLLVQQAKLFYPPDVSKWPFTSTGYVSPYGITSVCVFTASTGASCDDVSPGIVAWIEAENANRSTAGASGKDLITYTLISMAPGDGTYEQQIAYWRQCPDRTDVVLSPLSSVRGRSLSLSQRRFKSVVGTNYVMGVPSTEELALVAAGWIFVIPISIALEATILGAFPSARGIMSSYMTYVAASGLGPPDLTLRGRSAEFGMIMAAMNSSDGLSHEQFSRAIMSLNGQSSVLGPIDINHITGANQANGRYSSSVVQLLNTGYFAGADDAGDVIEYTPSYPFDFFWLPANEGDELQTSQVPTYIVGCIIVGVFSAWIGQILFDSLVMLRERGSGWACWLFLFVTITTLASASISCVHTGMSLGMKVENASSTHAMDYFDWSVLFMFLQWGVPWLLVFVAMDVLSQPLFTSKARQPLVIGGTRSSHRLHHLVSRLSMSMVGAGDRRAMLMRREEAKRRSFKQEFVFLLRQSLQWRCLFAGELWCVAVILSRWLTVKSYRINATIESSITAYVFTTLMLAVMLPFVAAAFRHGLRWRIPAVFLYAAAIRLDWHVHYITQVLLYAPSPAWLNGGVLYSVAMTHHDLLIFLGLTTTFGSVMAVVFQYVSMRILHSAMLDASNKMSILVSKAEKRLGKAEKRTKQLNELTDQQSACLNTTNSHNKQLETRRVELRVQLHTTCVGVEFMLLLANFTQSCSLPHSALVEMGFGFSCLRRNIVSSSMQTTEGAHEAQVTGNAGGAGSKASWNKTAGAGGAALDDVLLPRSPDLRPTVSHAVDDTSRHSEATEDECCHEVNASNWKAVKMFPSAPKLKARAYTNDDYRFVGETGSPGLREIVDHACCFLVFKQYLTQFSSKGWPSLIAFYVLTRKYRSVASVRMRQLVASEIVRVFLMDGSPRPIRLSPTIVNTIMLRIDKQGICPSYLFAAAENEVLLMMEATSFNGFRSTAGYQLCCRLYASMDGKLMGPSWLARPRSVVVQASASADLPHRRALSH